MPFVSVKNGRIHSQEIEFNLVDHCNFSCDESSQFSPFMTTRKQDFSQFKVDLLRLAEVYRATRFRFFGGEPLLHDDIVGFDSAVKQSGIAEVVEIVSNGVLLDRMPDELFCSVDSFSISWYPDPRISEDILARAKSKCDEFNACFRISQIDTFRRMQVADPIDDEELVSRIYRSCLIAHTWNCQNFYDGRFYLCSRSLYTRDYYRRIGAETESLRLLDGIPLHEPNLKQRIFDSVREENALTNCRYCLGTLGAVRQWRQLSVGERRSPVQANSIRHDDIDSFRMRWILLWRATEKMMLNIWPSTRLARIFGVVLTAIVGDWRHVAR